ncbi:MAG: hypothetical protein U0936_08365 [Planctomycetaceae bacterium]
MNSAYLLLLAVSCGIASVEIPVADFGHTTGRLKVGEESGAEIAKPGRSEPLPDAKVAFRRMPIDQVQARLLQWMALAKVDELTARQVSDLWKDRAELESLTAEESVDRIVDSLAIADESARKIIEICRTGSPFSPPNFEGVRSDSFYRDHVQLYYARWLTQHRFYDEAIPMLESLTPESVADPASLFFYRAICRLRLLKSAEASDDLALLLNNTLDVPSRFRRVAELMQVEAGDSSSGLPEVAKLMSDVQRRLDLGNSNDPVQKREEEVIAALDKLLKEMEEQQKQQQQQQSGQGGGQQQNQPGQQGIAQSTIKGSSAEGEADRKDLTENGNWGMLDKQAEAQAKELIRQQFPPNFLDAISRYTKRIAEQKK